MLLFNTTLIAQTIDTNPFEKWGHAAARTDPASKLRVEKWRTAYTGNEIVSTTRQQLNPCLTCKLITHLCMLSYIFFNRSHEMLHHAQTSNDTVLHEGITYTRTAIFVENGSTGHNEIVSVLTTMIFHHFRRPIHQILFIPSESTPHATNVIFRQAFVFNFRHMSGIRIDCRAFIWMRELDNTLLLYLWQLCSELCFPFFVFIVIITGSACVITKRISVESKRGANFTESWEVFIPSLSFFFNVCFTISGANDVSQLDITFSKSSIFFAYALTVLFDLPSIAPSSLQTIFCPTAFLYFQGYILLRKPSGVRSFCAVWDVTASALGAGIVVGQFGLGMKSLVVSF